MALTDKNIVITPNIGATSDPKIVFSGADASTTAQNITLTAYPTANGTLSFDGSVGQLFSITNSLSGSIFSVNDVSGIPSIEVLDTGNIKLAQYGGNIGIGTSSPSTKLTVAGAITITGAFALRGSYGAGAISTNFAAGDGALASNTTGAYNTASGLNALYSNTTGYNNSASGVSALANNTTGAYNTASGLNALYSNTTGNYNTASGQGALYSNTTGNYNTASGQGALQSNTTGAYNTAMGMSALYYNTTGTSNSAMGVNALANNTTGAYNTASGVSALANNTTGAYNTASGQGALQSNTTGAYNTAMGMSALYYNTTGTSNSAMGVNALQNNTTGYSNSAVGQSALQDLTTTTIAATAIVNGTAYQIVTMGTTTSAQWIASGAITGRVGETFTANATAGVGTGTVATSANIATQCLNNTALGRSAGRGITTGSGNTVIGANVTGLAAGLTNNVIIANGTGSIRVQSDATTITFADVIKPPQAVTASAPAYVKGGMYFDTTLNKMRIGGATAWETVTSV
jgi:hypothetical protein